MYNKVEAKILIDLGVPLFSRIIITLFGFNDDNEIDGSFSRIFFYFIEN